MYHVISAHKNVQDSCHGGALAALVDVATTINILRMTSNRTVSISLNTEFLNAVKL
jgi:acyl-coenzyme A thioesterase PaaI-like protein